MPEQDESQITASDLPFALYLDQRLVFDVLAALENGFVQFSTVQTSFGEAETNQKAGGIGLGISNVFALVGIQFGAQGIRTSSETEKEITTEQIVHTPTSLFAHLRKNLFVREMVKHIKDDSQLEDVSPGDFVEFRATLKGNPLEEMLMTAEHVLPLMEFAEDGKSETAGKGKQNMSRMQRERKQQKEVFSSQISALRSITVHERFKDFIAELNNVKIVLTTEQNYFIDPTMNNVIDGSFIVFGKATRVLYEGDGSISLLRKSALGRIGDAPNVLSSLVKEIDWDLQGNRDIEFHAPAMQVIPMAIFS